MKTTNPELVKLIRLLIKTSRESKAKVWRDVADRLSISRRRRVTINVSLLNRHTKEKETVVIPGKVLGAGTIDHPVNVSAVNFSNRARFKIMQAGGNCTSIANLLKENPKGNEVKILG